MAQRKGISRLTIERDVLVYQVDDREVWRIAIADLVMIGEMTNDRGPFEDDYFFVFFLRDGACYEASFYAEACADTMEALGDRLGTVLLPRLTGSTDYASTILWPPSLEGEPLFDFAAVRPRGFIPRVLAWIVPRLEQSLTPRAKAHLAGSSSSD